MKHWTASAPRHIMGGKYFSDLLILTEFLNIKVKQIEVHIAILADIRENARDFFDPCTQYDLQAGGYQGDVFGIKIRTIKQHNRLKYTIHDKKDVKYYVCLGLWHPIEITEEPECDEDCRNLSIVYEVMES